jgi:hypothetical protein
MSNATVTHEPRRAFQIRIDDQPFEIHDPVVTGRQILDLAGKRPVSEFVVLQYLPDGLLEEIRLEETTDLRERGVERFITFESDRIFRFTLDEREFAWGAPVISGAKLKELAGVDPAKFDVWQEVRKSDDRLIGDKEKANLDDKGTERFFTAAKTTTEG